ARLLVKGPDASGIVASYSQLLYGHGCGIVDCASESSESDYEIDGRMFFQRIVFDHSSMQATKELIEKEVEDMSFKFGMGSQLSWGDTKRNIAIFVSKYDHCLWELLLRHRAGELACNIKVIISNHENLRPVANTFKVPYFVFAMSKETKLQGENKQMELLREHNIDLLVLARYMQVLSPQFCSTYPHNIINIHHSFLPAFTGGSPYHRAHERGVKLIGATAHYATMDLDEGPIIEQDINRVSHRDDVKDLIRKGRTLEKNVLVSAVKAHLEDRIIVHRNKCIVFAE
ncbi:formyltetrahydrofolate deformylase, partial [Thalassiosira pseudonana CCMP1335]